ncbi:MAG TPA: hypothetical protein VJ642_05775 [Chromobacteriaceae bacterium]|nr:hypothetical protein [Chromobacteriaceae bacterium]
MTTPRIRFWPATTSFRQQQGFATLLIVLLTGLSLTAITMGVMHYIRGAQDAQMTSHAQTQAEIKAWTGVQALSKFLQGSPEPTISAINSITLSSINGITINKTTSCPAGNYCFDVTGQSGNAKSTVRTVFSGALGTTALPGTIFAGGLNMQGNATLTATTAVSIGVGSGGDTISSLESNPNVSAIIQFYGISDFSYPEPVTLKPLANYIFTSANTSGTYSSACSAQLLGSNTCPASNWYTYSYDTTNNIGTWTITGTPPAGVLYFDGNVIIKQFGANFVNTVIATGTMVTDDGNNSTTPNTYYAPNFEYYRYSTATPQTPTPLPPTKSLDLTCNRTGVNIPNQLCSQPPSTQVSTACTSYGNTYNYWYLTYLLYLQQQSCFPNSTAVQNSSIGNILFYSGGNMTINGNKTTGNTVTPTSYYGNIIANTARGGTGSPSGKVTGNGAISITGDLVVTNPNVVTEMNGNIKIFLANATAGAGTVPTTVFSLKFAKYL